MGDFTTGDRYWIEEEDQTSCLNLIIYYSEDGEVVTRFPYVNLPGGRIIDTRSTLVSPFSICTAHFIYHYFSFLYQSFI